MPRKEFYNIAMTFKQLEDITDTQAVGLIRSIYMAQGGGSDAMGKIFSDMSGVSEVLKRIEERAKERSADRGLVSGTWEWMSGRDQRGASEKTLEVLQHAKDSEGYSHDLVDEFKRRFSAPSNAPGVSSS